MTGLAKIGTGITKAVMKCKPIARLSARVSKNKPEILAVSGGVLIVAAFGWAIYEAVGMKPVLDETANDVKAVEEKYSGDISEEEKKQYSKELRTVRIKGVIKVSKRFVGPSVALIVGMGLSTKGFKILKARNVVLGTALKGTEEAYKFYRNNVREDLGKDADLKYARGIVGEKEIEETVVDDSGKEKTVKTKVPVVKERNGYNPFRFEFSDTWFRSYQDSTDQNLFFLKCEQDWWNHEFDRDGEAGISMYDILRHLGYKFEVNKDGMSPKQFNDFMNFVRNTGWKKGSKGDGFIDFGIYRAINESAIRRLTDVVWIEFNCDGPLDQI